MGETETKYIYIYEYKKTQLSPDINGLTVHADFDPLGHTWRHTIRCDAQVGAHVQSRNPLQLQGIRLQVVHCNHFWVNGKPEAGLRIGLTLERLVNNDFVAVIAFPFDGRLRTTFRLAA